MSDVLIRPAAPADAHALAHLHVECWRGAYRGIMPDAVLEGLSVASFASHWEAVLAPPAARSVRLAEHGDALVGFTASGPSRDPDARDAPTAELYALYVLPSFWGRRIGWRLWRAAHQELLAGGYREATLWVLEANARARAFYEQVGFCLEPGRVKTLEREGARLAEMRYRLLLRARPMLARDG